MIVRVLLVVFLAVAMLAARGPIETPHDGEVAAALFDVDRAVAADVAPPIVIPEIVRAVASTEVVPSYPDLGRVFRPPRASSS